MLRTEDGLLVRLLFGFVFIWLRQSAKDVAVVAARATVGREPGAGAGRTAPRAGAAGYEYSVDCGPALGMDGRTVWRPLQRHTRLATLQHGAPTVRMLPSCGLLLRLLRTRSGKAPYVAASVGRSLFL